MDVKMENGKLIITIDVSPEALKKAEPSKSGKTRVVASTHGFTNYGSVGLSLNCTTK